MVVRIEVRDEHGQQLWQVHAGRRCLTFQDERAARHFAAQLQVRLQWLSERSSGSNTSPPSTPDTQRPDSE